MVGLLVTFKLGSNEKKVYLHVIFTFLVILPILAWFLNLSKTPRTTCSRALLGSGAGVAIGGSLTESVMLGQLVDKWCDVEQRVINDIEISYAVDVEVQGALV